MQALSSLGARVYSEIHAKRKPLTLDQLKVGTVIAIGLIGSGAVIGSLLFPAAVVDITWSAIGMASIALITAIAKGILLCRQAAQEAKNAAQAEEFVHKARYDGDPKNKLSYLIKAADLGHTQTQYRLGLHYYTEGLNATNLENRTESYKKAFDYYSLAAKSGHSDAQLAIGKAYENGIVGVVSANCAKAFKYYNLAAEQGLLEAHCQMAYLYYNGYGVVKDDAKAYEHAVTAAVLGSMEAVRLKNKLDIQRVANFIEENSRRTA